MPKSKNFQASGFRLQASGFIFKRVACSLQHVANYCTVTIFTFWFLIFGFWISLYAQEQKEPIIINGDTVEYSTDAKEATATGNVSVIYKGAKLSCHKLTINTQTKDAQAEGGVRLEEAKGVIEGEKIKYNFQTKTGMIIDASFRANPYFGKAQRVKKVSDAEFMGMRGYMTTCNFDNPHYRIKSKKMDILPDDKIKTKDDTFYAGKVPLLYIPEYNHSLKEPFMNIQMMPGKKKEWGPYLLTASRYKLAENIEGRIYFDERAYLGNSQGFGLNYATSQFGKGDYKFYYTQERDKSKDVNKDDVNVAKVFQRYLIRWRHKWDIDEKTNLVSEYYKIVDSKMAIYGNNFNILKDYFFREYEKNSQPPSYALLHHNFNYSTLDFNMQKRTNRWYSAGYIEKLPEVKYSFSSLQVGDSPFYFGNDSAAGNFNSKNTSTMTPALNNTSVGTTDTHVNRFDTVDKLSLPMKLAFVNFTPFASIRETFYSEKLSGSSLSPRSIFYSGADTSTKFYRIFNVQSNFLGLDINGLRHIITPSIGYSFNHEPSILSSKLKQIDGVDSVDRSNAASLELSNKLQTKRNNQSVDFLDFDVTNSYSFINPDTHARRGSKLLDFLFKLKLLPYSWMRINADTTYKHSGPRSDVTYNHFTNANYDMTFGLGKERSFSVGQRYQFKGGNQLIYNLEWRLTPKWKILVLQTYNRGHDPTLKRGLRNQEYTLSRDLHCWTWEATYNVRRGIGESIWFVFRLKAFPELGFKFNDSYHERKPGAQPEP